MFQVNDHVVFGTHGICAVRAIGTLNMSVADTKRLYYTLEPLYESQQSAIYTPVDNNKTPMRRAITREEAWKLIDRIPEIEIVSCADERSQEDQYKTIIQKNECTGWIQIIKTLYLSKQKRLAEGKKNIAKDEQYLKQAEDMLYGELAAALDVDKLEVRDIITQHVEELKLKEVIN
jgi:CarD family transcriptional regulator